MAVPVPSLVRSSARRMPASRFAPALALAGGALAIAFAAFDMVGGSFFASPAPPAAAAVAGSESHGAGSVELALAPFDLARPLIALLLLGGAAGLWAAWRGARAEPVRWGFGGVAGGLLALALAAAGQEWVGREALGPTLFGLAFLFEVVGLAAVVAGAAALGVLSWRVRALPRGASLALATAPLGFLLLVALPGSSWGGLLWLGVVWSAVGASLLRGVLPRPVPGVPMVVAAAAVLDER